MNFSMPDYILYNGTIRTLEQTNEVVSAIAICGKKIMALGDDEPICGLADSKTPVIDLNKRSVLPGFTDSHFHFYEWALNLDSIDFAETMSLEEMGRTIKEKAAKLGADIWVLGQGFNESEYPENRIPDRWELDQIAPLNPVCIWRCDLHLAVANSKALELAGITRNSTEPVNHVVVRDETGEPTGVLKELAPELIRKAIPELPDAELLENMKRATARAHGLGLTGIHDIRLMGGEEGARALRAWQTLHFQEALNLRCHVALPGEMTEQAIALGLQTGLGDDRLRIGHLKFFADGGMGARTAWMTEKYRDAEFGMPLTPISEIEAAITQADRAGLSCMVHGIGDRTNRELIQMFSRIEQAGQSRCVIPHRMEHLQMVLPEDLQCLSQLQNLVVSCQPNNLSLDINMIDQCAGSRGKYAYGLKSIWNTGLPMILGSDAPVADPNPLAGIYSAVTRKRMNRTPEQGWYPEQSLSLDEAIKGFTSLPAIASGMGDRLGSLANGKTADLVVLDKDPYQVDPDELADIQVDLTFFDGELVYER